MIARRSGPFPGVIAVVLGSFALATVINAGASARAVPAPPTPAIVLTVGDRSKPIELIHLLHELANYETMAAARYVAQADTALRRGEAPVVRIPMPNLEAAEAVAQSAPSAGATATVETGTPER